MATLAASNRTNTITLATATAGPLAIGFRIFDADAIDVYVNGERNTDFTVAASFSGGYDDDATITFDDDLEIGDVVKIFGDMIPKRQVDFGATDLTLHKRLNIELGRVWATLSDLRRAMLSSVRMFGEQEVLNPQQASVIGLTAGGDLTLYPAFDIEVGSAFPSYAAAEAYSMPAAALTIQIVSNDQVLEFRRDDTATDMTSADGATWRLASKIRFDSYSDFEDDAETWYPVGTTIHVGTREFIVASAAAADHHVTTAGGIKLYEHGTFYTTRARFVQAVARGLSIQPRQIVTTGLFLLAMPITFISIADAEIISDLPGYEPAGDLHLEHVVDNAVPGTTTMTAAAEELISWLDDVGGSSLNAANTGRIVLLDTEYYFATGFTIPNTLDGLRITGQGKGTVVSTDQNIVVINIGPDISGEIDTATSAPTYGTRIERITFLNKLKDSTNVAIQANRCPMSQIHDCIFIDWYVHIDGYRFSSSSSRGCVFNNQQRTTPALADIRLQGVYDSTNSHTPGGGFHVYDVELVGNASDRTMLEVGILVMAVDGLYLHSGHTKDCVVGMKVAPDATTRNDTITDIYTASPFYFDDPAEEGYNVLLVGTVGTDSLYQSIWFNGVKFRGANNANGGLIVSVTDAGGFTNRLKDIQVNGGEAKQHRNNAFRFEGVSSGKVPCEFSVIGTVFSDGNVGGVVQTSYIHSDASKAAIHLCSFGRETNAAERAVFITIETEGHSAVLGPCDYTRSISTKKYVVRRNARGRISILPGLDRDLGEHQDDVHRATTSGFLSVIAWEFDLTSNNQIVEAKASFNGISTDTSNLYASYEKRIVARRNNSGSVTPIVTNDVRSNTNLTLNGSPADIHLLAGDAAWSSGMATTVGDWISHGGNVYLVITSDGTAGTTAPTHTVGAWADGGVRYLYVGATAATKLVAVISGENAVPMRWSTRVEVATT